MFINRKHKLLEPIGEFYFWLVAVASDCKKLHSSLKYPLSSVSSKASWVDEGDDNEEGEEVAVVVVDVFDVEDSADGTSASAKSKRSEGERRSMLLSLKLVSDRLLSSCSAFVSHCVLYCTEESVERIAGIGEFVQSMELR